MYFTRTSLNYTINETSLSDLINYNEVLVLEVMSEIFEKEDIICKCPVCTEDIYALSLNSLPAKYIQDSRIKNYIESTSYISKDDVKKVVMNAVRKVHNNPCH
ncbi:MAG: late competence development ComFB family protein [Desulfobacterales bacterium]|nr:late competence development ComFB family protein [Desulfobacterales bacterium]